MNYKIKMIKSIWHQKRASLSVLILASIAVLISRWEKEERQYYAEHDGWIHLAYEDAGKYSTDYGVGYAFEVLCYKDFKLAIYSDGSI